MVTPEELQGKEVYVELNDGRRGYVQQTWEGLESVQVRIEFKRATNDYTYVLLKDIKRIITQAQRWATPFPSITIIHDSTVGEVAQLLLATIHEHDNWIGSVSWGTLRPEDLLEAFADELNYRDADKLAEITGLFDVTEPTSIIATEDTRHFVELLIVALEQLTPEGLYFGTHVGDGADFGYWPVEDLTFL